jgi:hypothetical protein
LLATETDSSVYDHNGDALKKTTYVPFVYTLEEDFASADEDVTAILKSTERLTSILRQKLRTNRPLYLLHN